MLFQKPYPIKNNPHFHTIYKKPHSLPNTQFLLYTSNNKEIHHFPLPITLSKKLANPLLTNNI
uniref:ribonuclease P protein component n=1 Tax=Staphylococcus aureus TaxID=1280 RepID=UPI0037DA078E